MQFGGRHITHIGYGVLRVVWLELLRGRFLLAGLRVPWVRLRLFIGLYSLRLPWGCAGINGVAVSIRCFNSRLKGQLNPHRLMPLRRLPSLCSQWAVISGVLAESGGRYKALPLAVARICFYRVLNIHGEIIIR